MQTAINDEQHQVVYDFSERMLKLHPNDIDYKEIYAIASIKTKNIKSIQTTFFKTPPTEERLYPVYAFYLYSIGEMK